MSLNIRYWLTEHYLEIEQIKGFSSGQIAGIAYHIVEEMEVKSLVPFDICTLVEVLELPLSIIWSQIIPFAQLTESLLCSLSQKKPVKRNEGTWLAFQIAYLQALHQILGQEASLNRSWLDRAMIITPIQIPQQNTSAFVLQHSQLQGLLKTLRPGKLTDTQAEQALSLIADSLLVRQINHAVLAWLIANGAEEPEAKLLIQRLINSLVGHLLIVIANHAAPLAQLQKFVHLGNYFQSATVNAQTGRSGIAPVSTVGDRIDLYREYYRATLLQNLSKPLFLESFCLKDIYIPLTGLLIEDDYFQPEQTKAKAVDLMFWAKQQLDDLDTIAIIESESGHGKTSFCQIWAAQVARELYPDWMPVLIRLRDVTYGSTLAQTLNSAFEFNLHINLDNWLEQDYPRCLLILDGLDELPGSGYNHRNQARFMQQLIKFQSQHRHKIVLTSRNPIGLSINLELQQVKRIIIQPFDVDGLRQWFQQWSTVQSLSIAQNLFTFCKQAGLFATPSRLPTLFSLIRQPFMLYLLGILHRDGILDEEVLSLAANTAHTGVVPLLWQIHHRLSCWLLGYPQNDSLKTILIRSGFAHIHRTPHAIAKLLAGSHPQDLWTQILAIALKILHSQRQQINLGEEFKPENLPSFYFHTHINMQTQPKTKIEFSHPQLGEYLCAEAIASQLQTITQYQKEIYKTNIFILDSPTRVAEHLYKLLGYGILSQEIEEFVIEKLRQLQKSEFCFTVLFLRLESFWRDYCQGRWLDEGIAHQTLPYFREMHNQLNVEQVNAAVGLNVFLLLCSLYQEAKVNFWACGNPANIIEFNPIAIKELISKTVVLHPDTFRIRTRVKCLAGLNLWGVYLSSVMFTEANLQETNLSDAELTGINLSGANLQKTVFTDANLTGANLTGANLTGANLTGANLTGANLTGANLTGVNLNAVNLTNACLFHVTLNEADKEFAALNGAIFSPYDFPATKNLSSSELANANVDPDAEPPTEIWVTNSHDTSGNIESAEGIPVFIVDLTDL